VVSISWGKPEPGWTPQAMQAMEQAFQDAANMGIPVCVASGDNGSSGDGTPSLKVNFPASAPHALACGGTTFIYSGTTVTGETVWNDQQGDGSGGGVSQIFPKPAYQSAVNVPPPPAGTAGGRGVPDVAGVADPATGYIIVFQGAETVIGGTSAVAPLWAGLLARIGQSLGRAVGFPNNAIYQPNFSGAFHDITQGNNDTKGNLGQYSAGPGWDPCTGLGSPIGIALLKAISPTGGPHGTGSTGSTGSTTQFAFESIPPQVVPLPPASVPAAPAPVTVGADGNANAAAIVAIAGLAATASMVTTAAIVATVALSKNRS
jgi:kumamolisin